MMLGGLALAVGRDLRLANKAIEKAIADAGAPPRGVTIAVRGQVSALQQIFGELVIGLLAAIGVILLLLTANFQSLKLALVVLSTAPAVLAGSILMLLITGTTLNLESFMWDPLESTCRHASLSIL